MAITIRHGATVSHFQGIAPLTKGSEMNYSVSACPALSRSVQYMQAGESFETIREALAYADSKGLKICKRCRKAAEANIEPEVEDVEEEESAPEYRGHRISCPFFGPDYDHCDCGTESDARVIVEDTEACESCSHPMDEHSHGFDCDQCACGDSKYTAYDEGTCKSQSVLYGVACARTQGHLGLHRNSKSAGPKHGFTDIKFWGTNEAR